MNEQPFDPNPHLIQIQGKSYLETKWRLVWLRSVHPDASVETELVRADERGVTVRADISWPVIINETLHIVHSSGYALEPWEKPKRIGAPLENAETSAVGRALAAAGFGTQFAPEMDFDAGGERVVDSPAQRTQARSKPSQARDTAPAPQQPQNGAQGQPARYAQAAANDGQTWQGATPRQLKYVHVVAREAGLTHDELQQRSHDQFESSVEELSRRDMSSLIDQLTAERNAAGLAS